MGIEPTHTGTTIRGLDRLATPAVSEPYCNQDGLDSQPPFSDSPLELLRELLCRGNCYARDPVDVNSSVIILL